MSESPMDRELAAELGQQHSGEQLVAALRATAAGAAAFRKALVDEGFTRTEAMALVGQWLVTLMTQSRPK